MEDHQRVQKLIEKGKAVLNTHKPNPSNVIGYTTLDTGKFIAWKTQVLTFLKEILSSDSPYIRTFESNVKRAYKTSAQEGIGILESVKEDIENGLIKNSGPELVLEERFNPINPLENIFEKFHQIVRQLRTRYDSRETIDVKDEYDVQNLLHSLLHLYFEDIRPEEWTPSYAGKSSRMDFLLKDFKVIIEVKKTRRGLTAKELGSQLIEDITRYQAHPECETLICFAYDPEGLVANPRGLENDLNRNNENGLDVRVFIRP